ncbi:MAG: transposase, partial [Pyrinomonadaceae bacterium]|nr:transposase [Pyrinomonadaceae bacterium]
KLKANSSSWVKTATNKRFAWQRRYAAFSVSESQVERVRSYIRNQEAHHRRTTFADEYKALLRAHHIDFDEEHLWT